MASDRNEGFLDHVRVPAPRASPRHSAGSQKGEVRLWPAARPTKTSALYESLKAENAVFGVSYGLEVPLFFAPPGAPAREKPSIRRSDAFQQVAAECRVARSAVTALDASSFAKYEVAGPRAGAALDRLLASRLPEPGKIRLTPMLASSGRLMGDVTTMCLEIRSAT